MLYFVFLVYFDWMRHLQLPVIRQQLWAYLHFPFHLAMVLFMEGSTQFVIWWKILEVETNLVTDLDSAISSVYDSANVTTAAVYQVLSDKANEFIGLYPPVYTSSFTSMTDALSNISSLPESTWLLPINSTEPSMLTFRKAITTLVVTADNILLARFGIDLTGDLAEQEGEDSQLDLADFELKVNTSSWERFNLVVSDSDALQPILSTS